MESVVYLVRHGEAMGDEESDPGLSTTGSAQAHALGARLADVRFDEVLHSSRRRARETAHIVATFLEGCAPHESEHAADRTPMPSDQSQLSARLRAFLAGVPDDECDVDGQRLDQAIGALRRVDGTDRRVLVVTHNFVIAWFVRDALGAPPIAWTRLNSANGALTIIRYPVGEPARLIAFNDTGHLPDP